MRKALGHLMMDYLYGILFYLIVGYFVSANRDAMLVLKWNPVNIWLTVSYVLIYPIMMALLPKLRSNRLIMDLIPDRQTKKNFNDGKTYADRYHDAINPTANRYDIAGASGAGEGSSDDILSLILIHLKRAVFIVFSIPMLIVIVIYRIGRYFWRKRQ
ncbi:hypothetical protein [Lactiplantibacillus mudanjiangensis]|uniref:Uncharacterized protein n=1 Tax=Lactiplantibacillus mudanjiangensis TaxID=1296538 RepID=A0A660DZE5_9LACO|nr:hypothetical protein [Lactiplantibacillus mudanjiangensis]VDG19043.1 hypothetical protein (plasmid) [Lactobacillus plantarum] [Lactiplantibacillus mudanjiangensis]VDG23235.1 hypothetical protein (plasmid) [Lactobacillus plantarum] [Lactiplantibacillus mudanjiangensis]VDG27563.1 hypothetical protein (plasmid) [Lactobacillus plantarum] [Lactiplantibacillus mudanjiangensis]